MEQNGSPWPSWLLNSRFLQESTYSRATRLIVHFKQNTNLISGGLELDGLGFGCPLEKQQLRKRRAWELKLDTGEVICKNVLKMCCSVSSYTRVQRQMSSKCVEALGLVLAQQLASKCVSSCPAKPGSWSNCPLNVLQLLMLHLQKRCLRNVFSSVLISHVTEATVLKMWCLGKSKFPFTCSMVPPQVPIVSWKQ